ncbi:MAG: hypothetical protein M0C28_38425 [Candidatus Moduliflexus flocculans]|nr:hypothetical protein [Candidatus Moduliflexus flocculans]
MRVEASRTSRGSSGPLGEEGLVEGVFHADEEPDGRVLVLHPERDLGLGDLVRGGVPGLFLDDALDAKRGQGVRRRPSISESSAASLEGEVRRHGPALVPFEDQIVSRPADEARPCGRRPRRGR